MTGRSERKELEPALADAFVAPDSSTKGSVPGRRGDFSTVRIMTSTSSHGCVRKLKSTLWPQQSGPTKIMRLSSQTLVLIGRSLTLLLSDDAAKLSDDAARERQSLCRSPEPCWRQPQSRSLPTSLNTAWLALRTIAADCLLSLAGIFELARSSSSVYSSRRDEDSLCDEVPGLPRSPLTSTCNARCL